MHAHAFQVFGSPAVSVVINGCPVEHFHENDVPNMSLLIQGVDEVCHVMFVSTLNREVKIISNNSVNGEMQPYNGMCVFEITETTTIRFEYSDAQVFHDVEEQLINVFHDPEMNPSFGALPMKVLKDELLRRCPSLSGAVHAFPFHESRTLHCYEGKDKLTWVVLHSHKKKVNIPSDRAIEYSLLLKYLIGELIQCEMTLSDLFRKIYRESIFNRLLSSNFTVLKKLLVKFNTEFLWFQDINSKTTKVIMNSPTIQPIQCV
mmetsp:Transcript_13199/g.20359  ORF Transcript_13199/g.20359 Transcript_13199/m.20359 type:complete len:261 (-) Transcript_13199:50-832(-)